MKKIIFILTIVFVLAGCFDKNIDKLNNLKRIHVEKVSLSNTSITTEEGETITLTATISPLEATNKNIIWVSSEPYTATVDTQGIVTALSEGSTRIQAITEDGRKIAYCTLKVNTAVVHVTSLSLDTNSKTMTIGDRGFLWVTINPENATNQKTKWASDNTGVVTVNGTGNITAVGVGKAVITVISVDGEKTATCSVTVEPIEVIGVRLSSTTKTMTVGDSGFLYPTVEPFTATNKNLVWTSDNMNVAKVDNTGKVTAMGAGTATITVKTEDNGSTANCVVTVKAVIISVTDLVLNKSETTITVGNTENLIATISPDNATDKNLIWTSNNMNVAKVDDNGKITAAGAGTATITVKTKDGGKTAICVVTAKAVIISATGVTLNKSDTTITVGKTEILSNTISPENATNKNVVWTSNNKSIATVDSNGKITGLSSGTAIITVTTQDGGKTATCTVTVIPVTIAVTSIVINKTATQLTVGETEILTIKINPTNAINQNVTWSANDKNIATVDSRGKVTALGVGTTTIVAKVENGGMTAICIVTVKAVIISVTDVTLNKSETTITIGNTENLIATISPEHATDKTLIWTSNNMNVAKVDDTGKITAVGAGTATINVKTKDGGKTATCTVTVIPVTIAVTSIGINKTATQLTLGNTENLIATIIPENATDKTLIWTSNNINVVKVDDTGKITAVGAGTATITVKTKDGGKTASCTVTVIPITVAVTSIGINKTSTQLTVGNTENLIATVSPENATDKNLIWTSNNKSIATVDSNGKITGLSSGTTIITVTTQDGGKTATCVITVKAVVVLDKDNTLKSITIDANGATIPIVPLFSTGITDYSAMVEYGVISINISVVTNSMKAKVQGNGIKTLVIGDNKEYIVVTAEDGSVKSYCLVVTRKDGTVLPMIGDMLLVSAGTTTAANGGKTVDADFYIGKYEVTQSEFEAVMGFNPSSFTGTNVGNNPVEKVTWYDAVVYCNEKSIMEGLGLYYNISGVIKTGNSITVATVTENTGAKGYRLPTTEEWEYAARGGKNGVRYTYSGSNTIGDVAWSSSNSGKTTHPVGEKTANELGIYDMSGNVWEWTNTIYSDSYRLFRGGSWNIIAGSCAVSLWYLDTPELSSNDLGFRPARSK